MSKTSSVFIQMQQIMEDYSEKVVNVTESAMDATARESAQKLRSTSPRQSRGKHPGRYADGWAVKKLDKLSAVVYNRTDYQLTHLLENGHAVKPDPIHPGKKTRVDPIKHIKPVEEWAQEEFPIKIARGLE